MKPKMKVAGYMLALFCAAGCSESGPMSCYVTIAPTVRARVTALAFEPGDRIGLSIVRASEPGVRNRPMTYDGTVFAGGLEWYAEQTEPSTLVAYYPYSEGGVPAQFSVAADQRDGCEASDLLGAVRTGVVPGAAPVSMVFQHLMAQLTVLVDNRTAGSVQEVVLEGFATAAAVDLEALEVSVMADAAASEVKACEVQPGLSYRAVLVPQQADLTVSVITSDGVVHRKTIDAVALESGHCYDLTVEVTGSGLKMQLSGEIRDWIDGGSIGSGKDDPGHEEDPGVLVYEGETYATALVGGRLWMAENLRYKPASAAWKAGIWYPEEGASGVAAKGLLYDWTTAFGGETFDGQAASVRGVCPPGWHIPVREELEALVDSGCDPGFFVLSGCWIHTTSKYGSASYLMSASLSAQNTKMACLKISAEGAHSFVSVPVQYGVSLRCVKDE